MLSERLRANCPAPDDNDCGCGWPEYADEVAALEQRVEGLEIVLRHAEIDVRKNLNPMLERMGMHPFTLLEEDLQKALASQEDDLTVGTL